LFFITYYLSLFQNSIIWKMKNSTASPKLDPQNYSLIWQGEALRDAKKPEESAYAAPDRPFSFLQIVA